MHLSPDDTQSMVSVAVGRPKALNAFKSHHVFKSHSTLKFHQALRLATGIFLALSISLCSGGIFSEAGAVPKSNLSQGIAQYNKGYVQQAIPFFERALAQSPNNEEAALWLARAYQKQGLQAEAKQAYKRVLSINSANSEALSTLGELYTWDLSTRAEGVSMLERAYNQTADPLTGKKLSDALLWMGRHEEALNVAYPLREQYASDKKWMNSYAQILAGADHPAEAVEVYESKLNITESRDLAQLQGYATALFKSGQRERAEQVYQSIKPYAMNLPPEQGVEIKRSLAALAFDLGLYNDSVEIDGSLPEPQRSEKATNLRISRALLRGGRTPEAVDLLYKLYQSGELDASEKIEFANFLEGENLAAQTLPENGLVDKLYQQAINDDPKNVDAALHLAQRYRFMTPAQAGVSTVPPAQAGVNTFEQADRYYQQAWQLSEQYAPEKAEGIKKEYLEFLKTNKTNPEQVEYRFKGWMQVLPDDPQIKGAYAEYLSYQDNRRVEAIRMYLDLAKSDTEHQELWKAELDKVLGWHTASTELIPLYQEIVNTFPNDQAIWQTVGRAYAANPEYYPEALEHYSRMLQKFPNEPEIRKDWIALLMGNPDYRDEAIQTLESYSTQAPGDLEAQVALGKLYAYDRKYKKSLETLDAVLEQDPEHKDAAVAKGYTLMWSGKKLKAKEYLSDVWTKYPDDIDVGIALAQANKFLGRYDEAFEVMRRIRPQLEEANPTQKTNSQSFSTNNPIILCAYEKNLANGIDFGAVVWDSPVLPPVLPMSGSLVIQKPPGQKVANAPLPDHIDKNNADNTDAILIPEAPLKPLVPNVHSLQYIQSEPSGEIYGVTGYEPPLEYDSAQTEETPLADDVEEADVSSQAYAQSSTAPKAQQELQSDLDSLDAAIESLNALQASSSRQLNQLQQSIVASKDKLTAEVSISDSNSDNTASGAIKEQMEEYAMFSSLGYDTNPLLSGLGRLKNNDLQQMERGLQNDLRPLLRAGYGFDTKSGEPTTSRLRSWGIPNQIAFSISPQIRARFGINPYKYYIPSGRARSPRSTWSQEYTWGLTAKLTDRFTFDGDMAITHFNQSDSNNITYDAALIYDINDEWRIKLGSRRVPQFNSLLSVAGLRPGVGAFDGNLLGQSRETGVYGELNWNPTANWDVNLGYEWAFIDGKQTPTNYKNQAFFSPGYTWYYADNHKVRLGYEFLFMNYSKNTNVGYFDTTSAGVTDPVASLNPLALAADGYSFGGYFSPKWFFQNAGRLDFRGNLFNKFLEYKLGGGLGVQTFGEGHGIRPNNKTALTGAADLNLIANLTDWLALYGYGEYLKAGSVFTRWRFGGGVIVRPKIDAISPIFGKGYIPPEEEGVAPSTTSSR
ncbi:MAG: tetratricopeptide repeat protein [Vampirovibrionales bacterium]|nr:tetratricopeptide repeat protein [Vampirovibrionales bacterium]